MLRRSIRFLDFIGIAAALIGSVGVAYFLSTFPIAFQKSMSLSDAPIIEPDWTIANAIDARKVIGSIPYHGSEALSDVLPRKLYERTILEGYGNCANKTRKCNCAHPTTMMQSPSNHATITLRLMIKPVIEFLQL